MSIEVEPNEITITENGNRENEFYFANTKHGMIEMGAVLGIRHFWLHLSPEETLRIAEELKGLALKAIEQKAEQ